MNVKLIPKVRGMTNLPPWFEERFPSRENPVVIVDRHTTRSLTTEAVVELLYYQHVWKINLQIQQTPRYPNYRVIWTYILIKSTKTNPFSFAQSEFSRNSNYCLGPIEFGLRGVYCILFTKWFSSTPPLLQWTEMFVPDNLDGKMPTEIEITISELFQWKLTRIRGWMLEHTVEYKFSERNIRILTIVNQTQTDMTSLYLNHKIQNMCNILLMGKNIIAGQIQKNQWKSSICLQSQTEFMPIFLYVHNFIKLSAFWPSWTIWQSCCFPR